MKVNSCSAPSGSVSGTAELRTVTLVFNVTVPAATDGTGRQVNIAGFLDRLDGGHPQWDPGGTQLTRVDATHWTITFTGLESTQLEYKYALGSWDYVEKDGACGEIGDEPDFGGFLHRPRRREFAQRLQRLRQPLSQPRRAPARFER